MSPSSGALTWSAGVAALLAVMSTAVLVWNTCSQSTRQRFGALDFGWPAREVEIEHDVVRATVARQSDGTLRVTVERSR